MNSAILGWLSDELPFDDVAGKRVLEVGSGSMNGTVRSRVMARRPAFYLGVDTVLGPGVDVVGDALTLTELYPPASFDVVICTETLEHIADWQTALRQLLAMTTPGGLLVLTTRTAGFFFHGCPDDFWRFSEDTFRDLADIAGLEIVSLEPDPDHGVMFLGRRTTSSDPADLDLSGLRGVTPMERPEFLILNKEGLLVEAPRW